MSTSSGQPQFHYTQTPSKVLHLRNLPWECTEEELVDLCKPFGEIFNTKCNAGANRNLAFVEFVNLNQAISMVSYYASSSEPAQVRGKTMYIQYSNRQEIVNNKSSGDVAGNVLLVTIEGVEAGDVSIDVIHLVFSAFGFVHKIATFEKAAGFQALIQFSDAETASSAKNALDWGCIPRYLLPEHVGSCHLRFSFSAHTDLNIKFQSHRSRLISFNTNMVGSSSPNKQSYKRITSRLSPPLSLETSVGPSNIEMATTTTPDIFPSSSTSLARLPLSTTPLSRDYTNPYLPVNPSAIEGTMQPALGPDGKKKEPEANVLLASIENMQYVVTVDVLHKVFSAFGTVQKIGIFEKNGGMQALIQYPDVITATVAKEALEGHCIYDGGYCKLHLSYSRHTDLNVKAHNDRSRDYTIPESGILAMPQQASGLPTAAGGWQSPQAASMFPGNEFAVSVQPQVSDGQVAPWDPSMQGSRPTFVSVPSTFPGQTFAAPTVGVQPQVSGQVVPWDPSMQGSRPTFVSVPSTFPGQTFAAPTVPLSSTAGTPLGPTSLQQPEQGAAGMASQRMTQYARQPNMRPGVAPPTGQLPYYGR
ncbi:hypothetical protein HHK36_007264 [Tetracentron sinense]|uniref:RRM domain-containing protein n=1 Tax=Tetracentron sinense TaxID=13715 RepID=A0A835DLM9_TETSI|nr:hypothetical protein HHK36_007264 [Tetracentron sinense]